jgi:hypothetical protein
MGNTYNIHYFGFIWDSIYEVVGWLYQFMAIHNCFVFYVASFMALTLTIK